MTDFIWPPSLRQSSVDWRIVSNSEALTSPYSGQYQTASRPGDRFACTVRVANASRTERRRLLALAAKMRGRGNRILLPDLAHQRAGNFPTGELLSNTEFASTSGWTPGADASLSATDGALRVKRTAYATVGAANVSMPGFTAIAHVPYVGRAVVGAIKGGANAIVGPVGTLDTSRIDGNVNTGYSLAHALWPGTSGAFNVENGGAVDSIAGDYFEVDWASASRCALADGGVNLFTRSEELGHADWTKNELTVTSNATTGANGQAVADRLVPSTNNAHHYEYQGKTVSSAAGDFFLGGFFKANGYNFVRLELDEATTTAYQLFNLNTGAVGATSATGANFANLRAVMFSVGNGWYYCGIVVRKTNAATLLNAFAFVTNADSAATFAGNGTSGVYAQRLTFAPGSVPARLVVTSATASSGGTQQGTQLYVKGLPFSTNGLLLVSDPFEVDKQMKRLITPVDSDGAGCALVQFEPGLPRAISDNTPIIVHQPLCKMIMVADPVEAARPGGFSDIEFDFVQDLGS